MDVHPLSLLVLYCVLIVTASVMGGWLPSIVRMTHLRTQLLMSFVAGLMLGISLLHMLPHSAKQLDSMSMAGGGTLAGILLMFVFLRAFHAHQHDHPDQHSHSDCDHHDHGEQDPSHDCDKHFGWIGMLFGLGLHTLMDGVAMAASVTAESTHSPWLGLAGLGTFLAIALHKPLDAFALASVMKKGGWTTAQQSLVNVGFSTACPLGAALFYLGVSQLGIEETLLGWGLALSAGFFICIALADLLPEVFLHDHDRLKLTVALLLGVTLAVAIENLPSHEHPKEMVPRASTDDATTPA